MLQFAEQPAIVLNCNIGRWHERYETDINRKSKDQNKYQVKHQTEGTPETKGRKGTTKKKAIRCL